METATVLVQHSDDKFDYYKIELPYDFYECSDTASRERQRGTLQMLYKNITGAKTVMAKFDKIEKFFDGKYESHTPVSEPYIPKWLTEDVRTNIMNIRQTKGMLMAVKELWNISSFHNETYLFGIKECKNYIDSFDYPNN